MIDRFTRHRRGRRADAQGKALVLILAACLSVVMGISTSRAQSSGVSPSATANYLRNLRSYDDVYGADDRATEALDPLEAARPAYGYPDDYGRTRVGFSTSLAAEPKPYPAYDAVTRPEYYESLDDARRRLDQVQSSQVSSAGSRFDPFAPAPRSDDLNPYRNNFFRPGVSEGRFGTSNSLQLTERLTDVSSGGRRDNISVGDLDMQLGFIGGFDYTDNALFAPDELGKTSDLILRAGMRLNARYPLTRENSFQLQLGISYDRYLLNPDLNDIIRDTGFQYNISPGSRLTWDFEIGNVFITLFDSFSVSQRVQDDFLLEDNQNYAQFNNTFGIAVDWLINTETNLTVSANRTDRIALDSDSSNQDRTTHSILGSLSYSPRDTWATGLEASYSNTDRADERRSDSVTYTFGAFLSTPLSEVTIMRLAGGIQQGEFTPGSLVTVITDNQDLDDYFLSFTLQNRLNRYVTQTFSAGRESGLAEENNFVTAKYVRYGASVAFARTALTGSLYGEKQRDSGGVLPEQIDRWGVGLNLRHRLNSNFTFFLGYNYGVSDSEIIDGLFAGTDPDLPARSITDPTRIVNQPGSKFKQETFSFDIAVPFAREVDMILGYRRLKTTSSAAGANFTENRGSINFSYNF